MSIRIGECTHCGEEASAICPRCNVVAYCGVECQKNDWIAHHHSECHSELVKTLTGNDSMKSCGAASGPRSRSNICQALGRTAIPIDSEMDSSEPIEFQNPWTAYQQRRQGQQQQMQQQQQQQQLQKLLKERNSMIWYIRSFQQGMQNAPPGTPQYEFAKRNYDNNLATYQNLTRQIQALGGQ